MGTTQRLNPGVRGEPNWGNLNTSVTSIAKSAETEKETISEEEKAPEKDKKQFEKKYKQIYERRDRHLKSVYRNLFATGGGARKVSQGTSKSIGRAGLRSSKKLVGFIINVNSQGFKRSLAEIGLAHLEGQSFESIIDYLITYCSDSAVDMDDIAANQASSEVLHNLAELSDNDLDKFENNLKESLKGNGLSNLLCEFWGYYIFEHLSQRFQEKITQQKGSEISRETFKIIKDDILGRVKILNEKRPVVKINWAGADGKMEIEKIFESIINILCDEN
jgi:hypothetical protein